MDTYSVIYIDVDRKCIKRYHIPDTLIDDRTMLLLAEMDLGNDDDLDFAEINYFIMDFHEKWCRYECIRKQIGNRFKWVFPSIYPIVVSNVYYIEEP